MLPMITMEPSPERERERERERENQLCNNKSIEYHLQ